MAGGAAPGYAASLTAGGHGRRGETGERRRVCCDTALSPARASLSRPTSYVYEAMTRPDLRLLAAPFPPDDVEWKPGATTRDKTKGLAMAHISSRAVQDRLDEVCGPDGWRNEFQPAPGGGVLCGISVRVTHDDGTAEWITKWDGAENTDVEAVKGGLSAAMKRAAVQWGIARYLYNLPQQWVRLDERGRFAETPQIPTEFLPEGSSRARPRKAAPAPAPERPTNGKARPQLTPAQERVVPLIAGRPRQEVVDLLGRYGAERISELTDADAEALAADLA